MRLAALAIVTLLVALVVWRACSSGVSDIGAYIDSIRPPIQKSNELGAGLRALPNEINSISRETLEQRLSNWQAIAREAEADAAAVKARKGAEAEAAFVVAALHARSVGFTGLREALLTAMDGAPAEQATGALINAIRDFEAGDRAYSYFAADARDALSQRHEEKIEVPESVYIKDPPLTVAEASKFIKSVQSQPRLAPIHDLAVAQISTKPAAAGRTKDIDLVPASKTFAAVVTISNDGNQSERDIVVKARLEIDGAETQERTQAIASLEPGGKKAVTFNDFRPGTGDVRNILIVDLEPRAGEKNTGNNSRRYEFAMKA